MTLDLYLHLLTDSLDRATDLMAEGLAAPSEEAITAAGGPDIEDRAS